MKAPWRSKVTKGSFSSLKKSLSTQQMTCMSSTLERLGCPLPLSSFSFSSLILESLLQGGGGVSHASLAHVVFMFVIAPNNMQLNYSNANVIHLYVCFYTRYVYVHIHCAHKVCTHMLTCVHVTAQKLSYYAPLVIAA